MKAPWIRQIAFLAVVAFALPGNPVDGTAPHSTGGTAVAFIITSRAFENGGDIPRKYTCDGADVSPALAWSESPAGTQSLVLIADDPDAPMGTWVHWVVYDMPATARGLPEGLARTAVLPGGGLQGVNDFRRSGYGGPCPPPGRPHRYSFRLYALDGKVGLKAGAAKREVEAAMKGHILAQAELMGRYGR